MRIGLLTTLSTNIGDDFIREGLLYCVRAAKPEAAVRCAVNKHRPSTVYPVWHPLRYLVPDKPLYHYSALERRCAGLVRRLARLGGSRFDSCDLIIQCGAPVFWPEFVLSEWHTPIWEHILSRLSERKAILNLAGGSCYPWLSQPDSFANPADKAGAELMLDSCRLTTVRDALALKLVESIGRRARLIPCSASLAARASGVDAADDTANKVALNLMAIGGHWHWGQSIDPERWRSVVVDLTRRLLNRHQLIFLCHDAKEAAYARDLGFNIPVVQPATPTEYFQFARQIKAAVVNRLHAAVGLAGMGIPSVAVGVDTRMLMVRQFDLPIHYVSEVTAEELEAELNTALSRRNEEKKRLHDLCENIFAQYVEALRGSLSSD